APDLGRAIRPRVLNGPDRLRAHPVDVDLRRGDARVAVIQPAGARVVLDVAREVRAGAGRLVDRFPTDRPLVDGRVHPLVLFQQEEVAVVHSLDVEGDLWRLAALPGAAGKVVTVNEGGLAGCAIADIGAAVVGRVQRRLVGSQRQVG